MGRLRSIICRNEIPAATQCTDREINAALVALGHKLGKHYELLWVPYQVDTFNYTRTATPINRWALYSIDWHAPGKAGDLLTRELVFENQITKAPVGLGQWFLCRLFEQAASFPSHPVGQYIVSRDKPQHTHAHSARDPEQDARQEEWFNPGVYNRLFKPNNPNTKLRQAYKLHQNQEDAKKRWGERKDVRESKQAHIDAIKERKANKVKR